jgi:hypothetical protein
MPCYLTQPCAYGEYSVLGVDRRRVGWQKTVWIDAVDDNRVQYTASLTLHSAPPAEHSHFIVVPRKVSQRKI